MKKLLPFLLLAALPLSAIADWWESATTKRYFSQGGEYMLKVVPTYYPDSKEIRMAKRTNRKNKTDAPLPTMVPCHAILYRIESADTTEVWNRQLANSVAPVSAIVADDGKHVVTFDNWGMMGYGLNVMVVYGKDGEIIRTYPLSDFSPFPIDAYYSSISSVAWRCGARFPVKTSVEICFMDKNQNKRLRQFDLDRLEFTD